MGLKKMEINIKSIMFKLNKSFNNGLNCYLNEKEQGILLIYINNLEIINSDIIKEIREGLKCQQN